MRHQVGLARVTSSLLLLPRVSPVRMVQLAKRYRRAGLVGVLLLAPRPALTPLCSFTSSSLYAQTVSGQTVQDTGALVAVGRGTGG